MTPTNDLLARAAQLSKFLRAEHGERANDEMPEVRAYWLHLSYQTIDALVAAVERLQAELAVLREYFDAHQAVEDGVASFDLHNAAVARLEVAERAVRAVPL